MENIFNETPTQTNSNCKFMDHMYCHPDEGTTTINNQNNKNNNNNNSNNNNTAAISTGNNNNSANINNNSNNNNNSNSNDNNNDELEVLHKENKNFKSMLLLHFDLIQQQAEDLCAKEDELKLRTEECERLRLRNVQLEAQLLELQQQLEEQMKRVVVKRTSLPPPPLAKIQCLSDCASKLIIPTTTTTTTTTNATKSKVISKIATTTTAPIVIKEDVAQTINTKLKIENKENTSKLEKIEQEEAATTSNIIKLEQKAEVKALENNVLIKLEQVELIKKEPNQIPEEKSTISLKAVTTTTSNDTTNCFSSTSCSSPSSTTTLLTNSGKRRRLWHATDLATDEESIASFDSMLDIETRSTTRTTSCLDDTATGSCASSLECCEQEDCSITSESVSSLTSATTASDQPLKKPRYLYYTASSPYLSRPWQEEELDGDVDEDVAEALRAAIPKLEIPKWTEHDIEPLYNIEGTEDLSDEVFLKRHSKLELDEKRRKKWDVQQIREQRRLEKLRKRHCKDELIQGPVIQSFFPLAEELETICFVDMLPVQAFGEPIPILPHNGEGFRLPWLVETDGRPLPPPKKATEFYRFGLKKMTRREEKLWEETMDEAEELEQKVEEDMEMEMEKEKEKNKELFEENKDLVQKPKEEESNEKNVKMECKKLEESEVNSCDIEETLNKNKLATRIADCCYASSMVMLAKNGRQCASRTQMRKRLRYSSYIYLTKRKRQISLSTNTNKSSSNINNVNISNNNSAIIATTTATTTTTTLTAATTTTAGGGGGGKINIKNISAFRTNNIVKTTTTTNTRKITRQISAITTTPTTTTIKNTHDKLFRTTQNTDRTKENDKITLNNNNQLTTTAAATATTTNDTATTILANNNLKTKLRNLRVSLSPCNSNSNSSNSSTNISDSLTMKLIKTSSPSSTTTTQTSNSLNVNTKTTSLSSSSSSDTLTTTTTNTVVVAKTK